MQLLEEEALTFQQLHGVCGGCSGVRKHLHWTKISFLLMLQWENAGLGSCFALCITKLLFYVGTFKQKWERKYLKAVNCKADGAPDLGISAPQSSPMQVGAHLGKLWATNSSYCW